MNEGIANAVVGVAMVPLCLLGLLMAARAHDNSIYLFGASLAAFTALFGFGLIKRHYDDKDAAPVAQQTKGHP
jgi:hypothetical protein